MKKIPYGIADYKRVKEEDFYFIDKTRFIEQIESTDSYSLFLRPRRFGKSLLISMLHYYYDIHYKDSFDMLFGDTYIAKHKTKEANDYHILRFDFSMVVVDDVKVNFYEYLLIVLKSFLLKYKIDIKTDTAPTVILNKIFDYFHNNPKKKLYLLIDEYDNFANKLLLDNQNNYKDVIADKASLYKQFFTLLKGGAGAENSPLKKMFITGVTPMTMYDVTSGFNIGSNISTQPNFNDMVGINNEELEILLNYYNIQKKVDKALLKSWYNNYRFSEDTEQTIYNTDMILYYIKNIIRYNKPPKELIDINVRSDYSTLQNIIYTNNKLNGNFQTIKSLIGGEAVTLASLVQDFSALDISNEENFKSLLFYLGLITIDKVGLELEFKVPNETIKRIDIDFLKDALKSKNVFSPRTDHINKSLVEFARSGDIEVFKLLSSYIKESTSIRDYINNEQSIKAMLLAYLSLTPYYVIKSELELNKGFADLTLIPLNPYVEHYGLIELKYIKREVKNYKTKLPKLIEEAKEQLEQYKDDELLKPYKKLKLHKIVMVFWGWELVEIVEEF